MKKLFLFVCAATVISTASAQSNNPQNKAGKEVVTMAIAVQKDYKAGKIKDVNQATIDAYFKTYLPNYKVATLDEVNRVAAGIKGQKSQSVIANSGLSAQAQEFLRTSLTDYSTTKLVDDVNKSRISQAEKDQVLLVLAINYNLIPYMSAPEGATGKGAALTDVVFDVDFDDAQLYRPGAQSLIWGALGAIVGAGICGPVCAVVGGVWGLIFGSLPGTTTTTTGPNGGSHTYTNGGPKK